MTIQELNQYRFIKLEIIDLKQRIDQKSKITDVVAGSSVEPPYVKHPISITGYEYCSDRLQRRYKNKVRALRQQAEEMEDYISKIDDSFIRQIIRLRFIDGLSWNEVADTLGGNNTADSVKKAFSRYIRKHREEREAPH